MLDILLSDPFMWGVIGTVLFLLVLVIVVPSTTRSPERLPRQREWRVIEPAEQLPTVTAKRIEVQHGN